MDFICDQHLRDITDIITVQMFSNGQTFVIHLIFI